MFFTVKNFLVSLVSRAIAALMGNKNSSKTHHNETTKLTEIFRGDCSVYRYGVGHIVLYKNSKSLREIRMKWSNNQIEVWWRKQDGYMRKDSSVEWYFRLYDISNDCFRGVAITFNDEQTSQKFQQIIRDIFPNDEGK